MKLSQVAAQLYTVREFCQTATALAATARRIRDIGYGAVQLSALGPIPPEEIVRIMAGEGLTICATHEPSLEILHEPQKSIDRLQRLGCRLTAYAWPQDINFGDGAVVRNFVRQLDASGAQFRAAGLTLGYHNHDMEFYKFEGVTILEYIFAHTDPKNLVGEPDTYWIQHGGGDCVEWMRRLSGRMPFVHLKDYGITLDRTATYCEIGRGTLPFARIIAEAEQSGCEWFIVEQDTCPGDPFDSLRLSYDYIRANLVA